MDLTPDVTPREAGLMSFVKMDSGIDFRGRAALAEQAEAPLRQQLVDFVVEDPTVTLWGSEVILVGDRLVGTVTSAAFEMWGVPTVFPDRSRLAAMVKQLEIELPSRASGLALELATGSQLLLHGDYVLLDGIEVRLSPAPAAVLQALVVNPGNVVSRRALLEALPSGTAGSEHAVEMAVARLRAGIGTKAVQTVVKRGYRLAVA